MAVDTGYTPASQFCDCWITVVNDIVWGVKVPWCSDGEFWKWILLGVLLILLGNTFTAIISLLTYHR